MLALPAMETFDLLVTVETDDDCGYPLVIEYPIHKAEAMLKA